MTTALQTAWNEFLYGGHLQSVGAVAITWTAAAIFRAPFPWALAVATYTIFYAIYLYNRLLEVSADASTNPSRTAHIVAHRRTLWRVFFVSTLIGIAVAISTASLHGVVFIGALFVFGLLYTNAFKGLTRFVPGFKAWYVALGFSALVFLPFAYTGRKGPFPSLASFAGWVFWNAAIMQICLDVKDARSDAQRGLRTIPLLLGRKRTFRVLAALTVLSAVPPLAWGFLDPSYPMEIAALAPASLLSLLAFAIAEKGAYQGYLLESGKFISWPALLALARVVTA